MTSPSERIEAVLPALLVDEYGETERDWTELGSVKRIAAALTTILAPTDAPLDEGSSVCEHGNSMFCGECAFPDAPRDEPGLAERNPHLPEAPADGQHIFGNDGQSYRCSRCAVYNRPDVPSTKAVLDAPCMGGYAESAKMRHWADQEWAKDRALLDGDA